ncbi:MAG: hypothetical protein ACOCP9_04940, partial [Halofilum sp. (in: g-proteobacteria)]
MSTPIVRFSDMASTARRGIPVTVALIVLMVLLAPSLAFAQEGGANGPSIAGWLSILPPVIAIALALLTRQVIPSLAAGIWVGAWFANDLSLYGIWGGLLDVFDTWVLQALAPPDGDTSHM